MMLIYELDLNMLKVYLHIPKTKFLGQGFQMLEREQDRQTDRDRQTQRRDRTRVLASNAERAQNAKI